METRDRLKKLSRYELVELIYDLRRDNVELDKRLRQAEIRIAELEPNDARTALEERLNGMERLLQQISDRLGAQEDEARRASDG